MYIVTGGAGMIGSAVVWELNRRGVDDILIVDNLASTDKWKNLVHLRYTDYIHRDAFIAGLRRDEWLTAWRPSSTWAPAPPPRSGTPTF